MGYCLFFIHEIQKKRFLSLKCIEYSNDERKYVKWNAELNKEKKIERFFCVDKESKEYRCHRTICFEKTMNKYLFNDEMFFFSSYRLSYFRKYL